MKSTKLNIGWPTNSRLAQELTPLRETLELERQKDGSLVPREFRRALIRELRAQDIAKFLFRDENLDAGITGRDIMTEQMLMGKYQQTIGNPFDVGIDTPTRMQLLLKEEDKDFFDNGGLPKTETRLTVVTSYPQICEKVSEDCLRQMPQIVSPFIVSGKVEQIVRSGLIKGGVIGLDIVKKGETARANGLIPYGKPVVVSRPGLYYKMPEWPYLDTAQEIPCVELSLIWDYILDFIAWIREKARAADIPLLSEKDPCKRSLFEPTVENPL